MADDDKRQALTQDAALWAIAEGVEAETGDRFFPSLTSHLASALACQYAFVSELASDGRRFRTRSLWGRGRFLDNIELPLEGTPCESVLNGNAAHHPEHVCELFPEDKGLRDWRVESYCGVPLLDSAGVVVGHLAILDDKPMWDGPRGIAIMRIFAARARAEIERLQAEAALRGSEQRLARVIDSAMDAIVTFDALRTIELFNAAAERTFGCPAAEAIGGRLDRFLTDGLRQALDDSISAPPGAKPSHYILAQGGVRAQRASGEEFAVESTISGVEVEGRALYTLILRDVDERRRAEEQLHHLSLENEYLQEEIKEVHNFEQIVGQSCALSEVLDKVRLVAGTDSSVLLVGETGTGKELIARAVHSNSKRKDRPLIKVNCAALPTGLIESELFGHEKGAFTGATERRTGRFELARGGTIFLDEIGDMPPEVQVKLLRVLQEREFERLGGHETIKTDVRVIAATNRDLESTVAEGVFRRDLYYRLNVFPIRLPALRERVDDIPLLVHYFVRRYATKIGREIDRVPKQTMERLVAYRWPGNVRELENVIERATILSKGPALDVTGEALPAIETGPKAKADNGLIQDKQQGPPATSTSGDALSLAEMERNHILGALKRTNWRIDGPKGAARFLNVNPSTLRSRMKKLGIRRSAGEL